MRHSILIADDHPVLRAGLKLLINSQPDLAVIGEANNGLEAIAQAAALRPDIILMDISMAELNGLEAARRIKQVQPEIQVLFLTMHEEEAYLRKALAAGGAGLCPKSAADSELLSALRAVGQGNVYIHPSHTKLLLEGMLPDSPFANPHSPAALSDRENEVLRLVALGHTNQQVADSLFLSVKTVETYRARVMDKLGLRSRAALVGYALSAGLLSDE